MSGQIQIDSKFGKILKQISERSNVINIVEIGTWNGLGSTLCILEGIKNKQQTNFISIELIDEMHHVAKINLEKYKDKVKLLNGTIIKKQDLYWFEPSDYLFKDIEKQHFDLYYDKEVAAIKNAKNVIEEIPEIIDFLILDGGEYSTYPEWQMLKFKTNTVALDDTTLLKTKKIREELLLDNEWKITHEDLSDRNGYTVFERITYVR